MKKRTEKREKALIVSRLFLLMNELILLTIIFKEPTSRSRNHNHNLHLFIKGKKTVSPWVGTWNSERSFSKVNNCPLTPRKHLSSWSHIVISSSMIYKQKYNAWVMYSQRINYQMYSWKCLEDYFFKQVCLSYIFLMFWAIMFFFSNRKNVPTWKKKNTEKFKLWAYYLWVCVHIHYQSN